MRPAAQATVKPASAAATVMAGEAMAAAVLGAGDWEVDADAVAGVEVVGLATWGGVAAADVA